MTRVEQRAKLDAALEMLDRMKVKVYDLYYWAWLKSEQESYEEFLKDGEIGNLPDETLVGWIESLRDSNLDNPRGFICDEYDKLLKMLRKTGAPRRIKKPVKSTQPTKRK